MLYDVLGMFLIIIGILYGISTIMRKNNMPFAMFALQKEKYEVINKGCFNSVMLTQSIVISLWLLLIGTLCIIIKGKIFIFLTACSIFINIVFSEKAKKYIKVK